MSERMIDAQSLAIELGKHATWLVKRARKIPGAELLKHPSASCRRWMLPDTPETREEALKLVRASGRPKGS
jgi:hypothetical protein